MKTDPSKNSTREIKFLSTKVAYLVSVGDWKNHSEQFETHKNADGFLKYLNEQQGPIFQRLPAFQHCLRRMFFSFTALSACSRIY